jgi:hypothetical protein
MDKFGIQINKTLRNAVLFMTNIGGMSAASVDNRAPLSGGGGS